MRGWTLGVLEERCHPNHEVPGYRRRVPKKPCTALSTHCHSLRSPFQPALHPRLWLVRLSSLLLLPSLARFAGPGWGSVWRISDVYQVNTYNFHIIKVLHKNCKVYMISAICSVEDPTLQCIAGSYRLAHGLQKPAGRERKGLVIERGKENSWTEWLGRPQENS
jgi:hypothetical protein